MSAHVPGPRPNPAVGILRGLVFAAGSLALIALATLPLPWLSQLLFGVVALVLAFALHRCSKSRHVTLALMLLSLFSTLRYVLWRISSSAHFLRDIHSHWNALDAFFIALLLVAELYAFLVLALGYIQTLAPLRRKPAPLPLAIAEWPAVDLLIPTLDEPLAVVRFTALAALNIDWPADKLNVYILDDGNRADFRAFAHEAGIGYIARPENLQGKAGNINHALGRLDAPLVAIFDADHVPTRSFLQVTAGWFLRDARLGMLQTPNLFYSPDPFGGTGDQFRVLPNEGELFHGLVQDGNDFWNATVFCGSCAVIRRAALDDISGIATGTVSEDAHTSVRMQRRGWNTAYLNIPQAAGLATERLSVHVAQRIRWARGMVGILRVENPLLGRGLSLAQRLCYFSAITHFLFALPRLIFLAAPLIFLLFGRTAIPGLPAAMLAFALPHLALSSLTRARAQGQRGHFLNTVYETVLAPYTIAPTLLAMLRPYIPTSDTTAKNAKARQGFFDSRIALPLIILLLFNLLGVMVAVPRFLHSGPGVRGALALNVLWSCFNIVILGVATAVAWESQQRRQVPRVAMEVPANIVLSDGSVFEGATVDISGGGALIRLPGGFCAAAGDSVRLILPVLDGHASLAATIVSADSRSIRTQFGVLSVQEEEALAMILYSRADTWVGVSATSSPGKRLAVFGRILALFFRSLSDTLRSMLGRPQGSTVERVVTAVLPLLVFALVASTSALEVSAAQVSMKQGGPAATPIALVQSFDAPLLHLAQRLAPYAPAGAPLLILLCLFMAYVLQPTLRRRALSRLGTPRP